MRRLITPIALVLALATGAVLAETRMALEPVGSVAPWAGDAMGSLALVRDWYDAANRAIATGDAAALTKLLAPGFADHAVPPGEDGAAALSAYLAGLHATHPGARLVPLDLAATGDRVVARVRVEGAEEGRFLGLPVAGTAVWGAVDVFRVERAGIAEHWGDGRPLARLDPILTTPPLASAGGETLALERRTYPPGEGELLTSSGFVVVLVEAGELRFVPDRFAGGSARLVDRAAADGTTPPMPVVAGAAVMEPGDALLVDGAGLGELRNDGATTARALVLAAETSANAPTTWIGAKNGMAGTMSPVPGGAREPTDQPADAVTVEVIAGGQAIAAPAGQVAVTIDRAVLPTGGIAPHPVGRAELLAVEGGGLALTAGGDGAWVRRGAGGRSILAETAVLGAGQGALVWGAATARYLTASGEPAVLLLVTIAPTAD
jgi:hypothetical protein